MCEPTVGQNLGPHGLTPHIKKWIPYRLLILTTPQMPYFAHVGHPWVLLLVNLKNLKHIYYKNQLSLPQAKKEFQKIKNGQQ